MNELFGRFANEETVPAKYPYSIDTNPSRSAYGAWTELTSAKIIALMQASPETKRDGSISLVTPPAEKAA